MGDRKDLIGLGLDIGGSAVKAVVLATDFSVVERLEVPSFAKRDGEAGVKKALTQVFETLASKYAPPRVGIGCAGSIDHASGIVINSPNFADWTNVPLAAWVEKTFGLPTKIDNDANCAVLAEWKMGAAMGCRHAVLLTLGTGIGGGLILNGDVYRGAHGSAAELGHVSIHADGVLCMCGNRGCFERYCSGTFLKEQCPGFTVKQIIKRRNEPAFRVPIEKFLQDLKIGITSLANAFDPEVFLLGGGISDGLDWAIPDIAAWLREHAFPVVARNTVLKKAALGNSAGAIGAALL